MIDQENSQVTKNTVFIGGLPGLTKKEDLSSVFSTYGEISEIKFHNDINSKVNKGYGLIIFKFKEGYKKALKQPELPFQGRNISCQPYLTGSELENYLNNLNSRRLFIKYIPKSFTNEKLFHIFSHYGDVDFAYVVKDPKTELSKGFGYVAYKTESTKDRVLEIKSIKIEGKKRMKIFPYMRRGQSGVPRKSTNTSLLIEHLNKNHHKRPGKKGYCYKEHEEEDIRINFVKMNIKAEKIAKMIRIFRAQYEEPSILQSSFILL